MRKLERARSDGLWHLVLVSFSGNPSMSPQAVPKLHEHHCPLGGTLLPLANEQLPQPIL